MSRRLLIWTTLAIAAQAFATAARGAGPETITKLRHDMLAASEERYEATERAWAAQTATIDAVHAAMVNLKDSAYAVATTPAERIAVLQTNRDRAKSSIAR